MFIFAASSTLPEVLVTALLSSSFVGGIFTLLSKRMRSPETENDLARLGNEFAHQLLVDAKAEREELRLTIRELESAAVDSQQSIDRLRSLLEEKNATIHDLEVRQIRLAHKLQAGQPITLRDIFGEKAPDEFHVTNAPEPV